MLRRLFALLIAPLLGLGLLGVRLSQQAGRERVAVEHIADLVDAAVQVSALDAALGNETLVAISSNEAASTTDPESLSMAERSTDRAIADLEAALAISGAGESAALEDPIANIRIATRFRSDVAAGEITPLQLVDRYGTVRAGLVDALVIVAASEDNVSHTGELIGLISLIQARSAHLDERLGLDLALRYDT